MVMLSVRRRVMRVLVARLVGLSPEKSDVEPVTRALARDAGLSPEALRVALDVLCGLDYLEYVPLDDDEYGVRLTPRGQCYFEASSDARREFMRKSVFWPVVVSFATSLLLNLLLPWLQSILQW